MPGPQHERVADSGGSAHLFESTSAFLTTPPAWTWRKALAHSLPNNAPILPRTSAASSELSFGQQRLWFLAQLDSASAAYNVPVASRLRGSLDVTALQESLNGLVRRHESLRTSFPTQSGRHRQLISAPVPLPLRFVDLSSAAPGRCDADLARRIDNEIKFPFNLASSPLVRAALFRLHADEHVFVLTLHHIICDGPSIAILLQELSQSYQHICSGESPELSTPHIQYADFAEWQRESLVE